MQLAPNSAVLCLDLLLSTYDSCRQLWVLNVSCVNQQTELLSHLLRLCLLVLTGDSRLCCQIGSILLPEFLAGRCLIISEKAGLNYVKEVAAESHSEVQLTTADVAQDDDDLFSFMNSAGR